MMKFYKTKFNTIQKICFSAFLIALTIILQKVLAINYIPIIPFLRISFGGPALIIFSSYFLGPIYGLLIGASSDLLGYLIFDPKNNGFFPTITCIYAFLGLISFFIFNLLKKVNNKKILFSIFVGVLGISLLGITLFLCLNNEIKLFSSTYKIDLVIRILLPSILFVLSIFLIIFVYIFDKKNESGKQYFNTYQIAISNTIIEIVVMILFGSLMKAIAFGFETFIAIILCQMMVGFINIFINTVLITILHKLTYKYTINLN